MLGCGCGGCGGWFGHWRRTREQGGGVAAGGRWGVRERREWQDGEQAERRGGETVRSGGAWTEERVVGDGGGQRRWRATTSAVVARRSTSRGRRVTSTDFSTSRRRAAAPTAFKHRPPTGSSASADLPHLQSDVAPAVLCLSVSSVSVSPSPPALLGTSRNSPILTPEPQISCSIPHNF